MEIGSQYEGYTEELALPGPLMASLVRDVLARDAVFRFRAGGASMFPFVRNGDVISIIPLPGHRPGIGDVVVFLQGKDDHLVVHRLIGFLGEGCILKGDNYRFGQSDGVIPKTHLLGIVSKIERKGREVQLGLGLERYGIALLSRLGALHLLVQIAMVMNRLMKRVNNPRLT